MRITRIGKELTRLAGWTIWLAVVVACAAQSTLAPSASPPSTRLDQSTGLTLPDGYRSEVEVTGLKLPTHIAVGPDGAWYLTQLNGGENEGRGQVVRVKTPGADPEVVLDGLFKPTGLTWAGGALYIMSGTSVLVSHLSDGKFEPPTALFKDLPFNGRSEGQIFTGPDGLLYFESTGNEGNPRDSGFIYTARPDGSELKVYARGLKNAYAMAWDDRGKLYATEIGDGIIQDVGPFPEELNIIHRGGDYGWPYCYGNQQENHGAGGNRNICADTDVPLATFPPGTTPTGLAYFDGSLIVALWNGDPPRLLRVDPNSGQVSEFAFGFKHPIALLAVQDRLLVVDMEGGVVYQISKAAG
jgi:glucose/arabinose dehydrogenase